MQQDTTQMSKDNNIEQNVQPTESGESVDYKNLYLQEIQNAKKLRKRSQDIEKELDSFNKKVETDKLNNLKENEEYKSLADELQQKYDSAIPYKEKWETYETQTRETLLSKIPESDREMLAGKDLQTLEYIVSKQTEQKPLNTNTSLGASRQVSLNKDYKNMTLEEKKAWHNETISRVGLKAI